MEYVYMQKPRPTNATGVEVSLDVTDSNGNYRNIGTASSDANGIYYLNWVPDISGEYTVIASFAGSDSYWPSQAETVFIVDEAASTPPPTQALGESPADMYFVPAVVGIVVLIIVGFAVLAVLMLRKRP